MGKRPEVKVLGITAIKEVKTMATVKIPVSLGLVKAVSKTYCPFMKIIHAKVEMKAGKA